jgi:hypothetical protein
VKFEGVEGAVASSTKKRLDDLERSIALANVKNERAKDRNDKLNKTMINSQAGIQHLSNKLIDIKIDGDREFGVITDENIVAAIMQC